MSLSSTQTSSHSSHSSSSEPVSVDAGALEVAVPVGRSDSGLCEAMLLAVVSLAEATLSHDDCVLVGIADSKLWDAVLLAYVSLAVTMLSQADSVLVTDAVGATLGLPAVADAVEVSLAIGEVKAPVGSTDEASTVEMETFNASVLVGRISLETFAVGAAVGQTVEFSEAE